MLKHGHLALKPLKFDHLGGTFDSHMEVAANKRPLQTSLQVKLQQLSLKEILSRLGSKGEASGIINVDINLESSSRSPADFAAPLMIVSGWSWKMDG